MSCIIRKLQGNKFSYFLPPNIKKSIKDSIKKRESRNEKISSEIGSNNGKKQKQNNNMRRNENLENNYKLKTTENWNQVFLHESKEAPVTLNGLKACLKFHVKGFCV